MNDKVLEIIVKVCEDDIVKDNLNIDLFEAGLLDSIGFIELLVNLEDSFGITIAPSELDRSEINTPQKILNLVAERIMK